MTDNLVSIALAVSIAMVAAAFAIFILGAEDVNLSMPYGSISASKSGSGYT